MLALHLKGRCENLKIFNLLKERIPFRENFNVRLGIIIKDIMSQKAEISGEELAKKYGGFEHLQKDLQLGQSLFHSLNEIIKLQYQYKPKNSKNKLLSKLIEKFKYA